MLEFINQLGTYGWIMIMLTLSILFYVIKYSIQLFAKKSTTSLDINRIMIIAVVILAIGALSHYLGLFMGLQMFGHFSTAQFAAGYATSLIALMYGLVVFIVSTICWFVLRLKINSVSITNSSK